jgi:hypothetical protein
MALWGNNDSVYSVGTIAVDLSTGIGTGAVGVVTWTSAGITTGDVIQIGTGSTYGEAVITGFTSTTISLGSTQFLATGISTIPASTYNINQQPKYALGVGQTVTRGTVNPSLIYGVDELEVGVAATTAYAVTHSGWVAIGATYIDTEGNLRVKHEVLVAGGILTTTDANDDALFLP